MTPIEIHAWRSKWLVLRKLAYYEPNLVPAEWLTILGRTTDRAYDQQERIYLYYCHEFGFVNEVAHNEYADFVEFNIRYDRAMMGVDPSYTIVKACLEILKDSPSKYKDLLWEG